MLNAAAAQRGWLDCVPSTSGRTFAYAAPNFGRALAQFQAAAFTLPKATKRHVHAADRLVGCSASADGAASDDTDLELRPEDSLALQTFIQRNQERQQSPGNQPEIAAAIHGVSTRVSLVVSSVLSDFGLVLALCLHDSPGQACLAAVQRSMLWSGRACLCSYSCSQNHPCMRRHGGRLARGPWRGVPAGHRAWRPRPAHAARAAAHADGGRGPVRPVRGGGGAEGMHA